MFILNVISGSDYKIGFMSRKDDVLDKRKMDLIIDYTENTFNNQPNKNGVIKVFSCEYQSNIQDITRCINDLDRESTKIIYAYCSDLYFADSIKVVLKEKNILIWCINTYSMGSCEKNFVMGIGIVKAIEKCIYYNIFIINFYSMFYNVNKSRRFWLYRFKQKFR